MGQRLTLVVLFNELVVVNWSSSGVINEKPHYFISEVLAHMVTFHVCVAVSERLHNGISSLFITLQPTHHKKNNKKVQ